MSIMCRKPCKECPWTTTGLHSDKWPGYVKAVESTGKIKDRQHACHMITSDVWGYNEDITQNNVCIGAQHKKDTN